MELELEWKLGDLSKRLNARSMAADRTVASCATEYGVLVVVKLELGPLLITIAVAPRD